MTVANGLSRKRVILPMVIVYTCMWLLFFLLHPGSRTVSVQTPEGLVSAPGGNTSFLCTSTIPHGERGLRIQWLMNESAVLVNESIEQGNAVAYVSGTIEVLKFTKIPLEFNQTMIQCNASLSSGEQFTSDIVLLQLQGKCEHVG